MHTDLSKYDNSFYDSGAGTLKKVLWYVTNAILFSSWLLPSSRLKCTILRVFGATVGKNVVIKPRVNIKYPWFLTLGNYVWLGEEVWIDNLTWVRIHSNVCISQGAYILTGNHDYKDPSFGLIVKEITIQEGAWLGARSIVTPGVTVGQESVLTVASVLQKDASENGIYRGNPAEYVRPRRKP